MPKVTVNQTITATLPQETTKQLKIIEALRGIKGGRSGTIRYLAEKETELLKSEKLTN